MKRVVLWRTIHSITLWQGTYISILVHYKLNVLPRDILMQNCAINEEWTTRMTTLFERAYIIHTRTFFAFEQVLLISYDLELYTTPYRVFIIHFNYSNLYSPYLLMSDNERLFYISSAEHYFDHKICVNTPFACFIPSPSHLLLLDCFFLAPIPFTPEL